MESFFQILYIGLIEIKIGKNINWGDGDGKVSNVHRAILDRL